MLRDVSFTESRLATDRFRNYVKLSRYLSISQQLAACILALALSKIIFTIEVTPTRPIDLQLHATDRSLIVRRRLQCCVYAL